MELDFVSTRRSKIVRSIKREVAFVVFLKTALILLAAFTFFGAAHRLNVDASVMMNQLMG